MKQNIERSKSTKTKNRQDRKQRNEQNTFLLNVFIFQRSMYTTFQPTTPDASDGRGAVRNNRRRLFSCQPFSSQWLSKLRPRVCNMPWRETRGLKRAPNQLSTTPRSPKQGISNPAVSYPPMPDQCLDGFSVAMGAPQGLGDPQTDGSNIRSSKIQFARCMRPATKKKDIFTTYLQKIRKAKCMVRSI